MCTIRIARSNWLCKCYGEPQTTSATFLKYKRSESDTEREGGREWGWEFGWFSMASTFTFVLGMPFNNLNKSDYNQYYLHSVIFAALIHFNHIDIFTSLSLFVVTATPDPRRYFYNPIFVVLISFFAHVTYFFSLTVFIFLFFPSPSLPIYFFRMCVCTLLWFGHKCI